MKQISLSLRNCDAIPTRDSYFFSLCRPLTLCCLVRITESRLHHFSRLHKAYFYPASSLFIHFQEFSFSDLDISIQSSKPSRIKTVALSDLCVFSHQRDWCSAERAFGSHILLPLKQFKLKNSAFTTDKTLQSKKPNQWNKGLNRCIIQRAHKTFRLCCGTWVRIQRCSSFRLNFVMLIKRCVCEHLQTRGILLDY